MGAAEKWQEKVEVALLEEDDVVVLNPRRDDWDDSWEQSIDNDQFREQVEWELKAMENASVIAMYFSPACTAPITLMECGLFVKTGRLVICCPEGFWRKGNVDVVRSFYSQYTQCPFTQMKSVSVPTLDEMVAEVQRRIALLREREPNATGLNRENTDFSRRQ